MAAPVWSVNDMSDNPKTINRNGVYIYNNYYWYDTEAENSATAEEVSNVYLFPNPSWLVWRRASRHQKRAPAFPWLEN